MVTLQSSKKSWPGTALQNDIKLEVCLESFQHITDSIDKTESSKKLSQK